MVGKVFKCEVLEGKLMDGTLWREGGRRSNWMVAKLM
jgi:hypothetical protein